MVSVETIGSIFIKALKLVRFPDKRILCNFRHIEISVESLKNVEQSENWSH